jgi:hypothetical protein
MRPRNLAAALLVIGLSSTAAAACDSYDDDMSLASVLARAVAEARANGTLQPAGTLAIEAVAPEQAAADGSAGGAQPKS